MRKKKCTMSIPAIIEMYLNGRSTTDIAQQANVSVRHINSLLLSNNVERRPKGSWLRKYTTNEDYFKTWSNNMAYLLGFFAADGNMPQELQLISFSQKDPQILEIIKRELESTHPIVKNNTGVSILKINSKIMKDDLIKIHGFTPNKSNDIEFPYVPEEYISHFIRGYFDGDGNIYSRGYLATFVGGSLKFMNSLRDILEVQGFEPRLKSKNKIHRLYISGRKTIKLFYHWMYQNKELYLKRKFEAFPDKNVNLNDLKNAKMKTTVEAVAKRKKEFIDDFIRTYCVDSACKKVGIKITTYKRWSDTDKDFLKLINNIKQERN
ncbi:LAGLIDADG family homing endonuclease [Bacillus sp. NEB1478]|uniref:LAGLIDADG family homing endonuclease n=1 Tax=Bacillus sp. NEB1478 TaxID=3073816 RepID=UPI00287381D0|nr:LAGLIDADG family homing endonuclease [Bacillus sp. NEB1478]WNB93834.1 LAGLIDADG family homing endonuclease [Bacillus sp. NEB1478]